LSAACGGLVAAAPAKGYRVEPLKEAAPAEVAEPVRKALAAEGLRVLDPKGEPLVDVWLRSAVPTVEMPKAELNVKLGKVEEGALLGVIRFHKKSSDFKGNGFPAGVFTMRRGIQPVDGDHQGATETRDFALLAPAKVDSSTAIRDHQRGGEAVGASGGQQAPHGALARPGRRGGRQAAADGRG
jgi:hypothetical protein